MILALDTATRLASIALHDGQHLVSEATWHSAQQHTVELMPRVVEMLLQADVTPQGLAAVAVTLGPGSFTGLRVALSVAKGMVLGQDMALLGIPTLDVVAYPHRRQPLPVCALVQAGRGRVCWALYAGQEDSWRALGAFRISSVDDVAHELAERGQETLLVGEISPGTAKTLQGHLGALAHLTMPAETLRRAGYLAELAWARHRRHERDDVATLSPIYLHEP